MKCSPHVYIYSTFERVLRHKDVNQRLFRSFFLGIRYNGVTQSFFPVLTVWSTAAFNHVCIFTKLCPPNVIFVIHAAKYHAFDT